MHTSSADGGEEEEEEGFACAINSIKRITCSSRGTTTTTAAYISLWRMKILLIG